MASVDNRQDEDPVVRLVGIDHTVGGVRLSTAVPRPPTPRCVERCRTLNRVEGAELVLSADDGFRVIHDQTPEAAALMVSPNSDAFDVAGSEEFTAVPQGARHH